MPAIVQHSPAKLAIFSMLSALERSFRSRPSLHVERLSEIRNFLFLQWDTPLGSAVHATPVFAALRAAVPDAQIALAASPLAASVCTHNPHINFCTVIANPMRDFWGAVRDVRRIREKMPAGEVCIATTVGNQRSRIALLAAITGQAVRVGYTLASPIFDLPLHFRHGISQIDANLEILRVLGHTVAASEPSVFFTGHDRKHAERLLRAADASEARTRIACITQNSGGQPNQWREERFQQVIDTLTAQYDAVPIFLGGANEAGRIEQLGAVLSQCDLAVGLDTGTFHVARAVGLPGVVVAPGWQDPVEWLPVGRADYRVLWNGPTQRNPAQPYLDEISVDEVLAAATSLLASYPPHAKQRAARMAASLCDNGAAREFD
jgi:ADP-heptose:LPS heptosyltransferase